MSSLLSHHNLSHNAVAAYLRGFDHTLPISPEQWGAAESLGWEMGTIIICLEPVVPLTASAEQARRADSYKVTELGVVMGKDGERPIIVHINAETFELVYLEKLMTSKAQDTKLTGRDFCYVIVEPEQRLPDSKLEELQRLGYSYSRGGSRREKNAEGTGPVDPAVPLLTALGLVLDPAQSKHPLDIGLFCRQIFEPGEQAPDSPMSGAQESFRPVPRAGATEESAPRPEQAGQRPAPEARTSDLISSIAGDERLTAPEGGETQSPAQPAEPQAQASAPQPAAHEPTGAADLKSLLGVGGIFSDAGAEVVAPPSEGGSMPSRAPARPAPAGRGPQMRPPAPPPPVRRQPAADARAGGEAPEPLPAAESRQQAPPAEARPPEPAPESPETPPASGEKEPATAAPVAGEEPRAGMPPQAREPRRSAVAGSGMETLVARLEQQVSMAAGNLVCQVTRIHGELEAELKSLIEGASREEEEAEAGTRSSLQEICKRLDELTEDATLRISDSAATGRYAIKQQSEQGQTSIDEALNDALGSLMSTLNDLKEGSKKLSGSIHKRLTGAVEGKTAELSDLVEAICGQLDKINQDFTERLAARFDRLRERLSYEDDTTSQSMERHAGSLSEDLDGLIERALDKVESAESEHEIGINQSVTMYTLNLSQATNNLSSCKLLPKIRDYRSRLRKARAEIDKQLSTLAPEQAREQSANIESSLSEFTQQLQQSHSESQAALEAIAQERRGQLEKIFSDAAAYMEEQGAAAQKTLQEAESLATENDTASRQLVETSAAGTHPALTGDKESVIQALQQLKGKAAGDLQAAVDSRCDQLDKSGQAALSGLSARRAEMAASVSAEADKAISLIKKSIQDALQAIEATRERYLE